MTLRGLGWLAVASVTGGLAPAAETQWMAPTGVWSQPDGWTRGIPDASIDASVHGTASVTVPRGEFLAGRVEVGTQKGDAAHLDVDGGRLVVRQDSLIIGEATGGEGSVELNDGAIYSVMDLFVGGATGSTGRLNRASLVVRGGILEGLTFTVGEGYGSDAVLSIEGSKATAIHALEAVYLYAHADPAGRPGRTVLGFTLDSHGVTPIGIQSHWDGLRIEHDASSQCVLEIDLSSPPPSGDILLVHGHVPVRGTFSGMPEGADVRASYMGRDYAWTLTYKGGAEGHDLVLKAAGPSGPLQVPAESIALPWENRPIEPLTLPMGMPAFPGAEGYGAFTSGGGGGRAISVTSLADSGPGTLRAAIETAGPRRVVFRVGGVIALQSRIVISQPFLTVDGSEAPAPGIVLRGHGIHVTTHDVVLRQFRIRIGDPDPASGRHYAAGEGEYALDFTDGSRNGIADHLSLSWSTNKLLSTTKGSDLITVQWCILSESLNLEGHGYASLVGGSRVSWHHNLFAHNFSRNPRFQGAVSADFRDNVIYDWGDEAGYGEFERLNYVGNYLKPGPSRPQGKLLFHAGKEVVPAGSLYLNGNVLEGDPAASENNWRGTRFYYDRARIEALQPFPAPALSPDTATSAFNAVLAGSGATRPSRDAVDQRVVREAATGTGKVIQSLSEVGGWPAY